MTELTRIADQAVAALLAINLDPLEADIVEAERRAAEAEANAEQGAARHAEALAKVRQRQIDGPDAMLAANAIITGGDVRDAISDTGALEAEARAIQAGAKHLRQSADRARAFVRDTNRAKREAVGTALDPIATELAAMAKALAAELVEIYSVVTAISRAGQSHHLASLGRKLGECVAEMPVAGLIESHPIVLPAEVAERLDGAREVFEAIGTTVMATIEMPRPDRTSDFMNGYRAAVNQR
ncbi:hypothetical protein [Sphingomonas oligophenolica]|uniref:Uncharacterized protein n=1 Tax=Sphingomonas oligophenolica TaxID=301154 RepID=A0A502CHP5_9SPHN|nr:hypothetical protein [Sphingomonas oligophenolica]TPG13175.1 hypothetical protein EAH84_07180 [Sphingomonas oligophenolica]